jgi:hypothetical protein
MTQNRSVRVISSRLARAAVFVLLLVTMVGCGGTASVSGTVTYKPNGKKLVWGSVVLVGADGLPRQGLISPGGTYNITGVHPGKVKILVTSDNPKPPPDRGRAGREAVGGKKPDGEEVAKGPAVPADIVKAWFPIPGKYSDVAQSLLSTELKKGTNTFDIILD